MSSTCPTVRIKHGEDFATINEADFDPTVHEKYEEPKAVETQPEPIPVDENPGIEDKAAEVSVAPPSPEPSAVEVPAAVPADEKGKSMIPDMTGKAEPKSKGKK